MPMNNTYTQTRMRKITSDKKQEYNSAEGLQKKFDSGKEPSKDKKKLVGGLQHTLESDLSMLASPT